MASKAADEAKMELSAGKEKQATGAAGAVLNRKKKLVHQMIATQNKADATIKQLKKELNQRQNEIENASRMLKEVLESTQFLNDSQQSNVAQIQQTIDYKKKDLNEKHKLVWEAEGRVSYLKEYTKHIEDMTDSETREAIMRISAVRDAVENLKNLVERDGE